MPRVIIQFDPEIGEYYVFEDPKGRGLDPDYEVAVDLKASHFRSIKRNSDQVAKDQDFLEKFFIRAQMAGRAIREQ